MSNAARLPFPQISDPQRPSLPPKSTKSDGKRVYEAFQASLAKLERSTTPLDAARTKMRELLTADELEELFEDEITGVVVLPLPEPGK